MHSPLFHSPCVRRTQHKRSAEASVPEPSRTIAVLLAEDHAIVREGLRAFLDGEDGIEVVGEADNGREAVELVHQLRPDVVIMDVGMPQLNGMEATRQICKISPSTKVLLLSAHSEDSYIEQALAFGAFGYLDKLASVHELPSAIRGIHQGSLVYCPIALKRLRACNAVASAQRKFAEKKHLC